MREMGIEEKGLETPESRRKKRLGYYCSIISSNYPYYEEIVDNAFECPGLLDHIHGIKKAGKQESLLDFMESSNISLISEKSKNKKKSKKCKK